MKFVQLYQAPSCQLINMKRTLTILGIILVTHLPISCGDGGDGIECGGFTPLEARITELTPIVGTYGSSGFSTSITNEFDQAAINISITNMDYSEISQSVKRSFSLMSSAHACSPPQPEPTQSINTITITSESSVYFGGQEYLKGEDLSDLFKVIDYSRSEDQITVKEFVNLQNNDLWILGYDGAYVVFQLTDKPDNTINQKFIFTFEFSDSEKFEIETSDFEVNS